MKRTVAVDLDGTLAQYDGWKGIDHIGDPIPGARDFLLELHKDYNIVIWTTRCNPELSGRSGEGPNLLQGRIREWLLKHDMPFDDIFIGICKPIACAFFDDNAIPCDVQKCNTPQEGYAEALRYFRQREAKRG